MGGGWCWVVSTGIDMKANTRAAGALQIGDLRLLEDGGERGGALGPDVVASETVSEEHRAEMVRDQECQGALTKKRTLRAGSSPKQPTRALAASSCP